ncbi:MAG: hypothetical protein ACKO4L_00870 [Nodosilinea sp.]
MSNEGQGTPNSEPPTYGLQRLLRSAQQLNRTWGLGLPSLALLVVLGAQAGSGQIHPRSIQDLASTSLSSVQVATPGIPPLPTPIPAPFEPPQSGIRGQVPGPQEDLGLGHLHPRDLTALQGANWVTSPLRYAVWLQGVSLPIYAQPGGEPWAWLINGWLLIDGVDPIAIGRDASFTMVQPDRALYSFPVLEIRPDGWFRFRYTAAGSAWAHRSHLALGKVPLVVEPWADQVRRASRVQFRKPGLSRGLRATPQRSSRLRSLISPNSLIQPLDLQEDWLRVRVTQPAQGCTPLPGATSDEGWVRWRDQQQTLLLWFGTEVNCPLIGDSSSRSSPAAR